ncbi:MAG TPA: acyl-[acyl-carrier-protein] thioesterase [Treponema sp.]|nr:acyl-[acyl-carrier-protein] thioesterase [Treponema sp.]
MTTFRQWHDDDMTFNDEMKLHFCQCDVRSNLNFSELLRLTTDTAVEDYHQRGLSFKFLAENHIAILLSRIAFRFHRMPKANDVITIRTWEEKPEPLQLMRSYEIKLSDGTPLVSGYGSWLLVDHDSHRIIRPKDFTLRPEPDRRERHDCMEPGKIVMPENLRELGERPICYSDIDANGHMNNSRYGAFAVDCLPESYQQKDFTDFRMNYSKEAMKDEMIHLFGAFDDAAKKITVVGRQRENTCFESEFYYN